MYNSISLQALPGADKKKGIENHVCTRITECKCIVSISFFMNVHPFKKITIKHLTIPVLLIIKPNLGAPILVASNSRV
jgi:hypothetical protein